MKEEKEIHRRDAEGRRGEKRNRPSFLCGEILLFKQNSFANSSLFWKKHPALLIALTLLFGVGCSLYPIVLPYFILWAAYLCFCKKSKHLLILASAYVYGLGFTITLTNPHITGIFSPHSIKPHSSPFEKGIVVTGFCSDGNQNIPCSIYLRGNKIDTLLIRQKALVTGILTQRAPFDFILKVEEAIPFPTFWKIPSLRYEVKEKLKSQLSAHLHSPKAATFLHSLITGDVEDRLLRYELSRVGLQHILAVSGFHFGVLIGFLSLCLQCIASHKGKIFALLVLVSLYFFFVGSSPAVERSYLTAFFYLLGKWMGRPTSGLNLLGAALGIEVLFNPYIVGNIGFQLSFVSCASILLLFPLVEKGISRVLPKRSLQERLSLSLLSQHGYLFSSFFRKSLSLTCAINLPLLPLLLFHFHQFPLLSFLYNLFFPSAVGICLMLLLMALLFLFLFPPLGHGLFWLTNACTEMLLRIAEYPLLPCDFVIRSADLSALVVIGFFLGLGVILIPLTQKNT